MVTREFITALAGNAALLLSLVYTYDLLNSIRWAWRTRAGQVFTGIIIGVMGIFLMQMPWTFQNGIIFDTRSILLSISGLFFGALPTVVAMLMTTALRLSQGGSGVWMGISVIATSGALGIAWHQAWKNRLTELTFLHLYLLGLAVHLVMLALTFLLPLQTVPAVLHDIALPVLVIYPLVTAAVGLLFVERLQRNQTARTLRESESEFRALTEQAAIGVTRTEFATGKYVFVNQRFCRHARVHA